MNHTTPTITDPLRLSHCIECGYSLNGLPDAGACPECGRLYDQETVVLHGWARGSHANLANASPRIFLLICIPLLMFLVGQMLPMLVGRGSRWPLIIPLAIIGLLLWRRWSSPLPTLLQVNLSGAGCVEIDHVSLRRARGLTPWTKLDRIDIEELDGDRHRLRVGKHANWFGLAPALTVDAEVKCSPAQARALRDRIALWRDEAAASARTGGFPVVLES